MRDCPVATSYTLAFVREHLPDRSASVLEIGCGGGELAAALAEAGYEMLAIDRDGDCVATARSRGLEAVQAQWPAPIDRQFDAVLFTRSLHHIGPLADAVAAAVAVLRPGGRIIVEDFRIEADSARTETWFKNLLRSFDAAGELRDDASAARLIEKLDFGAHRVELHTSPAMAAELGRHGQAVEEDAAYYFRYVESELREQEATRSVLQQELALIERGEIDALGKRFVLTPSG